jgi:uncharacterized repeat protein (TIGR03847 family)
MPKTEIDLHPVDFITIGTIGPKGRRVFHLQAGRDNRLVSFVIEKEQAWALSEAIREFVDDLDERNNEHTSVEMAALDMELREPIQPLFNIAQMGLAYDEDEDYVVLVAQEMSRASLTSSEDEDDDDDDADDADDAELMGQLPEEEPGVVRMWCTRRQMRALSLHAMDIVESGRPSPKQNGRITYYWA